jgi:Zn finger protein HypA/HybF involved in hydrogenase expression
MLEKILQIRYLGIYHEQYNCTNIMSVILQREIRVEPMKCHRCSHEWNYSGKNIYVATCPHCRTTLTIRKHKRLRAD